MVDRSCPGWSGLAADVLARKSARINAPQCIPGSSALVLTSESTRRTAASSAASPLQSGMAVAPVSISEIMVSGTLRSAIRLARGAKKPGVSAQARQASAETGKLWLKISSINCSFNTQRRPTPGSINWIHLPYWLQATTKCVSPLGVRVTTRDGSAQKPSSRT